MNDSKWDQRTKRAQELAAKYPFAGEILRFYTRVFGMQRTLYAHADEWRSNAQPMKASDSWHAGLSVRGLVPRFQRFLCDLESFAPQPLAQVASEIRSCENGKCEDLLKEICRDALPLQPERTEAEAVVALLFLQPYLENLAAHSNRLTPTIAANLCPFCSGKPVVGVLRAEGDGGKRFLICSRCSTEWAYGRILCASCGEAAVDKLAVYTATQFEHVRVESCDSCGRYLKTVDLTRDGRAVPIVDELATIPLNLWADEHGYRKIQANVLGI